MYQVERARFEGTGSDVRTKQGQVAQSLTVPPLEEFQVTGIDVDAHDAARDARIDVLEPVARGTADDGKVLWSEFGKRVGKNSVQHGRLANMGGAHVSFIIGSRNRKPGIRMDG